MNKTNRGFLNLPSEQEAIRPKYFHPSGTFVEFRKEEIEQSIPARFEKIVTECPEQIAVKMGDRTLTYATLDRAANRVARTLVATRGNGNEPIALLFEHGIDVIVALLGVLKAGKFYVALDPSFPLKRIEYILKDSQTPAIITNNRNLALARELSKDAGALVNYDDLNDALSSGNYCYSVSPDEIAHLIYTSGSTGEPKGITHSHRNYLYRAAANSDEMRFSPEDRLSLLHSVSSGSSRLQLFQSLLSGARLTLFDIKSEGIHRLVRWLNDESITICHMPPAVFRQLADLVPDRNYFPSLRVIILSGAPITQRDFDRYKKYFFPNTALRIFMGATETVESCSYMVGPDFAYPERGTPIGYPAPGKKIFLLDDNSQEVKRGEVGEIAVKSRYLATGYWRQPELTRAKFLPDPQGGDEQIYLTGDLGQMLANGFLVHVGRKDFMVKIRGYRVNITEIEQDLLTHPRVRDAAIVAWDREAGEKYLAAYVVLRDKPPPKVDELRNFLKEKLPVYMIPSAFVFLETLPLTNGKLDRKGLPKPNVHRPELSEPFTPAQTQLERELVQIWEGVLEIRPIGIRDNFFDLGGHSLTATRVVSQVIEKFQTEIALQSLFQSPTIAEMTEVISQSQAKKLDQADLNRILAELELLSDEQAQQVIANDGGEEGKK
jgi:amino acid adenylation domain-containing protein